MKTVIVLVLLFGISASVVSQWVGLQPGYWGSWTDWSVCSKSCGGGTRVRRRECISPVRRPDLPQFILKVYREHTRRNCRGADAEYIACNTQQCFQAAKRTVTRHDAIVARATQCSKFNGTKFNGYVFNWVPYLQAQDSKECELNCLAKGHRFFLRLLPKVQDGTPCLTDPSKVCIDGKCQEYSGPCKGENCYVQPVKERKQRRFGVLTSKDIASRHLVLGYNPIITIPAGATDINVTEIHKSKNYLALKSHNSNKYYINGNWVIDLPKGYQVADTTVSYKRPYRTQTDNEAFIAKGPTSEDLDVMLLYQNEEPNIMYSYYLPEDFPRKPSEPQQPAEPSGRPVEPYSSRGGGGRTNNRISWQNRASQITYQWRVNGYSSCSQSCAGGTQVTLVQCVKANDGASVGESFCSGSEKPLPRQRVCNLQPCPPRWVNEQWGQCTKTCGNGLQIRSLRCKQTMDNNGVQEEKILPISQCPLWRRPSPTRECNLGKCPLPGNWTVGEWGECSVTCDQGTQRRNVYCTDIISQSEVAEKNCAGLAKPERTRACNVGSCKTHWFTSATWSKCSSDCGIGQQERLVVCGRKVGNSMPDGHCSKARKPETVKQCNNGECQSIWVTGSWSECSVDCGNGTQTRAVFCAGLVGGMYQEFPDEVCPRNTRPSKRQKCEKDSCPSSWFTSQWKECSRSCGGGSQSRNVICMNHEGKHSDGCETAKRPAHWQQCNSKACPAVDTAQLRSKCENSYSRSICLYVVQAGFCKYPHYGNMCCGSCAERRRRQ